jgi:hypothetical protein
MICGAFWFVFICTPAGVIATPWLLDQFPQLSFNDYGLIEAASTLAIGSFLSGFLLAKLYGGTLPQIIIRTAVFGFGFIALFAFIGYAGCAALKM